MFTLWGKEAIILIIILCVRLKIVDGKTTRIAHRPSQSMSLDAMEGDGAEQKKKIDRVWRGYGNNMICERTNRRMKNERRKKPRWKIKKSEKIANVDVKCEWVKEHARAHCGECVYLRYQNSDAFHIMYWTN